MSSIEERQLAYVLTGVRETRHSQAALLHSNILVARVIANLINFTYGPRGMDKLIRDGEGSITVSNDGATILKLLPVKHPIALIIVDTCLSHDKEVGDGTTGVVLLTSALLDCAGDLLQHVLLQDIIRGFQDGLEIIMEEMDRFGKPTNSDSLRNVASTSLNSKMLNPHSSFFVDLLSKMLEIVPTLDMSRIIIEKIPGAELKASQVIDGVMFEPTFSYAGADQFAKSFNNPKILILDHEVEHKHQKEYAQAVIDDPVEYNDFIKAEWDLVYEKLEKIVATGCNIVLNAQATGDVATQYFAERGIVCISRINHSTLKLLSTATHSSIQRSLQFLHPNSSSSSTNILGRCGKYELQTVSSKRYHVFSGCEGVASLVLRGGSSSVLAEAERSMVDAIYAMRAVMGQAQIVPGGGATEFHLASHIRNLANNHESGKKRIVLSAMAGAFEVLPRILADNSGFDAPKILAELSHIHHMAENPNHSCYGIDIRTGGVCDTLSIGIIEGKQAKSKAIVAAIDSACMVLSVDRIVVNQE